MLFARPASPLRSARSILLFAAGLCALIASPVRAELPAEAPHNALIADLGLHVIGLGYQRTVSPWLALQLDVESYSPWTQNINLFGASEGYESDLKGYVLRFRPILFGLGETPYPAGGPPTGFWISPFGQFGIVTATRDNLVRTGHAWAVGVSAGYGWLFFNHLALLIGAGGQYHRANIPDNIYPPSFARVYPTVDINVGYAF